MQYLVVSTFLSPISFILAPQNEKLQEHVNINKQQGIKRSQGYSSDEQTFLSNRSNNG